MRRWMSPALIAVLALGVTTPASAAPPGCPPGLAKKNPPCVPPGQVGKQGWLKRGDILDRDYDRVRYPRRYRLPPLGEAEGYYRNGRIVYRVDEETRQILDWIELTDEILGN
ncbi:MAG: excinuclease ABC subunit A [Paracoccaceae bacterium]